MMATSISLEIMEELGDLSTASNGWRKQLTYTSWNGRAPKFDLRSWDPDHQSMTKGLTLTKSELVNLKQILNELDFDKYED